MRDPLSWSLPLGRAFGISVRLHVFFPVVAAGLLLYVWLHDYPRHATLDAGILIVIAFASILLHEFGHCYGARLVDGDAPEILIWPLGGLASLDLPHRWQAHLVAVAAGPLTNLLLCVVSGGILTTLFGLRPPFELNWYPFRSDLALAQLSGWNDAVAPDVSLGAALLARTFWLNWVLLLINLLPGYPLDGGRLLQAALWPWYGFRQATVATVYVGFITSLVVVVVAVALNSLLTLLLAMIVFSTCRQQLILLETGGEESLFGYDFSQGYTSLEDEVPRPRRRQLSFWQRWLQRRAQRRQQRDEEQREADEHRMDQLLEKVQREGLPALSDEERRFLKRVSDRYRHR